ncbi:HAUS augmin-like complex subunit 6 [Takifugu rubripes]|uniref:HAUS augmin-like complex subunit 6 n=1 Tax=Takifugu rubripes TaxID=31033 RepID=UPI001145532A|nr:HAUS augmin-like complex subunit 6 [Takifugu rubripes]
MTNPASLQKRNGKYLWFALLGLGFQPDSATSSIGKSNVKHINLGPNMFDKPNKDAFYIVTHFLLDKLNPTRFSEAYRFCWPITSHKADAEFRKVTCAWLREIMDEGANAGSRVAASLFLSPGGPKFTSLMLSLAHHVMLQEMKTFHTEGSWVPEAAATPASSLNVAAKRLELVHRRFLRTAVEQDRFLHEYQRRAQLLVQSVKDLRAEGAKYDELLRRHGDVSSSHGASPAEKIRKVRSLWATVDGMLSSIKAEQEAVGSVLQGEVDQYVLDGTDRVLTVPQSLQARVEQLPHQLSSGRLYERGQLDLLCLLELTTQSLQLLREERRRLPDAPGAGVGAARLQDTRGQMSRALQSLQLLRQKISKDAIPEARNGVQELEADWDRKWSQTLRDSPLAAFLQEDHAVGLLSPMAPLSFEPVADASFSVFSQFPAALLGEPRPQEVEPEAQEVEPEAQEVEPEAQEVEPRRPGRSSPEAAAPADRAPLQANTSLDWLLDTPPSPRTPVAQVGVELQAAVKNATKGVRSETEILELEWENLAAQFADAVATPSEGGVKAVDLESLLGTLHTDPFSTRKQLPRTPESLILDVKSSWRKAVEEDRAEKLGRPGQQEAPSRTPPPLWDTLSIDASGDDGVLFGLEQETLPELPSLDEEDGSFLDRLGTPDQDVSASGQDWRVDLTGTTEKVFSLDLDSLETPSSPKMREYVLPNLITFSPIDDRKC